MMLNNAFIIFLSSTFVLGQLVSGDYTADAKADQVLKLPGLPESYTFNQFSGYLKVGDSKNLHYWMVESQGNPSVDPIAFWFVGNSHS